MTTKPQTRVDGATAPVLCVADLSVTITTSDGQQRGVLDGIHFELRAGQVTGLLGESGAGKSTLALALLRLLPPCFQASATRVELCGKQILSLSESELTAVRGARISLIHQDTACLNPVMRCGSQIVEVLRAHQYGSRNACREEARRLLQTVGLSDKRYFQAYPHQLSGGQKQRVVIAQAVACKPAVVIADEPTASLDERSARDVLALFRQLSAAFQTAFLVISHQPEIISLVDRALVMNAGRIVEDRAIPELLNSPLHPYTRQLLACRYPLALSEGALNTAARSVKPRWPCISTDAFDSGAQPDESAKPGDEPRGSGAVLVKDDVAVARQGAGR